MFWGYFRYLYATSSWPIIKNKNVSNVINPHFKLKNYKKKKCHKFHSKDDLPYPHWQTGLILPYPLPRFSTNDFRVSSEHFCWNSHDKLLYGWLNYTKEKFFFLHSFIAFLQSSFYCSFVVFFFGGIIVCSTQNSIYSALLWNYCNFMKLSLATFSSSSMVYLIIILPFRVSEAIGSGAKSLSMKGGKGAIVWAFGKRWSKQRSFAAFFFLFFFLSR